ncbi:C1 family peptidase [uncultured Bradyrhizobium sp.]|uniref:C1 family peptidase n=1 Tax=uncultured Bradyrhizobium sp. TaxID=199684 RepID=UPI0035C9C870
MTKRSAQAGRGGAVRIAHRNGYYGCRRDQKDMRDHMFVARATRLPPAVDLRAHCPPVMDQGDLGSCTAHGITGALRYEMKLRGLPDVPLSRLQLYYDERAIEGTIKSDAGAEIRDGIKCAAKIGVAHENLWPYNTYNLKRFTTKPSAKVYADAKNFMALSYQRVEVSAVALKAALAAGHTPIIGLTLYESFESDAVAKSGIVPMPAKHEKVVGGHCMYVVGYGQKPGTFTVRNSWAADWGDKGDCYFPEAYLGSVLLGSDYWIITTEGSAQ